MPHHRSSSGITALIGFILAIATAPLRAQAPPAGPKPGVTFQTLTRPVERGDIYASGNNGCSIYLNKKEIAAKVMREKATQVRTNLHEGDIIAVKLADRFDINSIWLAAFSTAGEFLFETSLDWKSYIPADPNRWWEVKTAKQQGPVEFAPDKQQYVDLVKQSASKTPQYRGAQPIRSTLSDPSIVRPPVYCSYTITKQDLLPKVPVKGK